MQDIIEILRQVLRGLDRLEVSGIGNAQLLGSCGDGLSAPIRGLRKLQAEEELQAAKQRAANAEMQAAAKACAAAKEARHG